MLEEQAVVGGDDSKHAGSEIPPVEKASVGMIIIDNITNVASSLVSKSPIQGQAILASFMRALQQLTSRRQMCTLLINAAVGLNPSGKPEYQRTLDDNVSIFSSSMSKPALGKAFSYQVDTSLFLSMLPKTKEDAMIAHGGQSEGQTWRRCMVLEVLKDRYGAREGRWVAFEILGGMKLVPCFTS